MQLMAGDEAYGLRLAGRLRGLKALHASGLGPVSVRNPQPSASNAYTNVIQVSSGLLVRFDSNWLVFTEESYPGGEHSRVGTNRT